MTKESVLIAATIMLSKGVNAKVAVTEVFELVDLIEKQADERAVIQLKKEADFRRGR
jgi:hypothetical protein